MKSMVKHVILVLNAGSSSIKFRIFSYEKNLLCLCRGSINSLDDAAYFSASMDKLDGSPTLFEHAFSDKINYDDAIRFILEWIDKQPSLGKISIIAHRIVHGGTFYTKSVWITPEVIKNLETLIPLAPLHQPHNLKAIDLISQIKPDISQIGCFDTAFHAHHTALFTEYALPAFIRKLGVRRYGFHGLSYEWIVLQLQEKEPELVKGRIIAAHLGNGASLCAILNGKSIDTTLGMTALAGLPMGTRSGDIDPGAFFYLARHGFSIDEIEQILYDESGLLGLSSLSNDVRKLEQSDDCNAQFALDYFCFKAAQFVGMMAVSIGGMDALVFTGGIGENSVLIREKIMAYIEFLMPFECRVIAANEEAMMAKHVVTLLTETGVY